MTEITKAFKEEFPTIVKRANSVARKNGHSIATHVDIGTEDKLVERVHFGYRKYTTGEYVSSAYRRNFGWKNTYYQNAIVKVMLNGNHVS